MTWWQGRKMNKQPSRKSLEEIERAERLKETMQVVSQPHRRGDDSDMIDPLGVFVRVHNCGRECYDAGWEYKLLVYRWRQAKGIPNSEWLEEFEGSGFELDAEAQTTWEQKIEDWGKTIARCDNAMKCGGLPGFHAARNLILEGTPPPITVFSPVKRALHSLAIELGKFPF